MRAPGTVAFGSPKSISISKSIPIAGSPSILTIRFVAQGKSTRLILDQKGVPPGWGGANGRMMKGWSEFYLKRVAQYFADNANGG